MELKTCKEKTQKRRDYLEFTLVAFKHGAEPDGESTKSGKPVK